jgi:CrcB protein
VRAVERFLWVCLAGAAGTGLRYLVGLLLPARPGGLALSTLVVNVLGCFLMGLAAHVAARGSVVSPDLRAVLTVGFLGGLTTYSAFNYETTRLLQDGFPRAALVNFSVTALACFAAGVAGLATAHRLLSGD